VSTACAAGTHALIDAATWVAMGRCDVVAAGGSEAAMTPVSLAGFTNMTAMSARRVSEPFSATRDGFVIAEGAAVLILEAWDVAEARGATIYTLSEKASDAEAEALAHKENRADIIAGIDLGTESEEVTDILIDLVQRESKSHSLLFARKAVAEMKTATHFTGKPLRSAGFVVLKAPDVPSVLIELGYLSSTHDEQQLVSLEWQNRVAAAMATAVARYFQTEVAVRAD